MSLHHVHQRILYVLVFALHVLRENVRRSCVAHKLRNATFKFRCVCAVEKGEIIGPAQAWEAIRTSHARIELHSYGSEAG